MITRNEVISLYRIVLDRAPESEEVINEKRRSENALEVVLEMLNSDEFFEKNKNILLEVLG